MEKVTFYTDSGLKLEGTVLCTFNDVYSTQLIATAEGIHQVIDAAEDGAFILKSVQFIRYDAVLSSLQTKTALESSFKS